MTLTAAHKTESARRIAAIKAEVAQKIEKLETKIAAADITLEESRAAAEKMYACMNAGDIEGFKANSAKAELASDSDLLGNYKVTMVSDLMYCPMRFVATDSDLISPAGTHPCQRVFLQTKVALHADSANRIRPIKGTPLNLFDLSKSA
jgi:hypothetical protein